MACSFQKENRHMASAKGSAKRADALTNRARILEAAQSVFAERGLELEMNEVAAQAQLGVGTLYGHFANREELLRAIVHSAIEDTLAQLRAALLSHADDPRAALQALVSVGLRVQHQYYPLFAVIRDPRLAKLLDPSYGPQVRMQLLSIPKDLLTQGVQASIFRQDLDQDMAAAMIMGACISAIDLLGMHSSLDELAQRLAHSLLTFLTERAETAIVRDSFSSEGKPVEKSKRERR
jgi:AcrR family transcriptional regulator